MLTTIFLFQSNEQTFYIKPLIDEAIKRGYNRFLTVLPLEDDWGLVFVINADSIQDFPDNLYQADQIFLTKEPMVWICERSDWAIAVWDGTKDATFRQLAFLEAWGITGFYYNPKRAVVDSL